MHLAVVGVNYRLHDREAETGPARATPAPVVGPPESLEDLIADIRGQPWPVVADLQHGALVLTPDGYFDRRALRRVDQRVAREICQNLPQLVSVGEHRQRPISR